MYILVYGTLRVGEYNFKRFEKDIEVIAEGIKIKAYRMFDLGSYPGITYGGPGSEITVDIINVKDKTFHVIDAMEKGANYYPVAHHMKLNGLLTPCMLYIYAGNEKIFGAVPEIESGNWKLYKMQNKYNRKIYTVGGDGVYTNWMEGSKVRTMDEADLVVFTGGEDVDPALYGENEGYKTYSNPTRDETEIVKYREALKLGKPMVGICRGAQFLCVMNGGKLIQHMSHPSNHLIITSDGKKLEATSTHHQMQYPYNLPEEDYKLLAWASELSHCHFNGDNQQINFPKIAFERNSIKEPEIVLYPKTKCLGIQMHPEYWDPTEDHQTIKYLRGLLNDLVGEVKEVKKEEVKEVTLPF